MGRKFIVSAFGKDRTGIVADVSQVLYENGCNLEDSRMANLSGEFSLIILFSSLNGDEDLEARLFEAYSRLESEKGISSYVRPVRSDMEKHLAPSSTHTLRIEGLDHTGIVYKISRYLADNDINIVNLDSFITNAPQSGASIYNMMIEIQMPETVSMGEFKTGLGRIADELHVEIDLK